MVCQVWELILFFWVGNTLFWGQHYQVHKSFPHITSADFPFRRQFCMASSRVHFTHILEILFLYVRIFDICWTEVISFFAWGSRNFTLLWISNENCFFLFKCLIYKYRFKLFLLFSDFYIVCQLLSFFCLLTRTIVFYFFVPFIFLAQCYSLYCTILFCLLYLKYIFSYCSIILLTEILIHYSLSFMYAILSFSLSLPFALYQSTSCIVLSVFSNINTKSILFHVVLNNIG